MHCTLKGTGGEEEDPPDVLWLRDGLSLHYTDTNQFQVHTGSNSWTVISTLRWVERPCSVGWTVRINLLLCCGSPTCSKNVCNAATVIVFSSCSSSSPVTLLNQTLAYTSLLTRPQQIHVFNPAWWDQKALKENNQRFIHVYAPMSLLLPLLDLTKPFLRDLYYIATE